MQRLLNLSDECACEPGNCVVYTACSTSMMHDAVCGWHCVFLSLLQSLDEISWRHVPNLWPCTGSTPEEPLDLFLMQFP